MNDRDIDKIAYRSTSYSSNNLFYMLKIKIISLLV